MAKFRKCCNLDCLDSSNIWQVHTRHVCKFVHFNIRCLQNEDLRPKNEDLFFLQAYQTKASQAGSTLLLRHQLTWNQWGLRFVD